MQINKVLFVGLGGAGQRHLRIFKELLGSDTQFTTYRQTRTTPLLNPNFTVNEKSTIENHYDITGFDSLTAALDDQPDLIVISTPSSLHYEAARMAADKGVGVFIEKPFSHNLDGFDDFAKSITSKNLPFFISYQRRFHHLIQQAQKALENGEIGTPFNAVFNVASFVPEWHNYEDFRNLYACRKELGGGVLLTEIHELDLCFWFFGLPLSVSCSGGNFSKYDLDVEDTAHIVLTYPKMSVSVNLCFMQEHSRRDFQIAGTDGFLQWDQNGNQLTIETYGEPLVRKSDTDFSNDDMFMAQARFFLEHHDPVDNFETIKQARASLAIVEAAKISMREGRTVTLSK